MESNAKWDGFTKVITLFVLSFFAVLVFKILRNFQLQLENESFRINLVILLVVVIAAVYLFSIKKYRLTDNALEIVRVLNTKTVPLSSLKEVRVVTNTEMAWTIRLFGSGGLFGFIGFFWNFKHKFISVYSTRMTRLVLITTTENKKLIISPEDFAFVEALQNKISKHES
jgi:hypothetical protein